MNKNLLALTGLIIFLSAILTGNKLQSAEKLAQTRDSKRTINAVVSEDSPPMCNWKIKTPERVMNENTTQALLIETSNNNKKDCETYLSLRAPGFDVEPSKDEQKIILKPNTHGSISWIISPRRVGNYDISFSDIINTNTFGISVTNMFGLNAFQTKVASILGSLFGPMFTIPWWFDRFKKRKKE